MQWCCCFSAIDSIEGSGLGVDNGQGVASGLTQVGNGTIGLRKNIPLGSKAKRIWPTYNYRLTVNEIQKVEMSQHARVENIASVAQV